MNIKDVLDTLSYVKRFAGKTILIKLGGAAIEDATVLTSICGDLMRIRSVGVSIILVHGGGPSINEELTLRGIKWEFLEGQRITTPEMMDVIEMVLCGKVNRRIVRTLNLSGVKAVGIAGSDAATLLCKQASVKLNRVGQIDRVDPTFIRSILNTQAPGGLGAIPVIAPVGYGKKGEAYNINADWAASRIASALNIDKMLFLTDQEGILDSNGKLITELDAGELEQLIESGVVKGGMLTKTQTILHALRNGVSNVHVLNSRKPHGLIEELFTDRGVGTACRLRSRAPERTLANAQA